MTTRRLPPAARSALVAVAAFGLAVAATMPLSHGTGPDGPVAAASAETAESPRTPGRHGDRAAATPAPSPSPTADRLLPQGRRQGAALSALTTAVREAVPHPQGRFAVGVLDRTGEVTAEVRGGDRFVTGSASKVDILVCLLLARQDTGGPSAAERATADRMIRISDNDAADRLLLALGGTRQLTDCHRRLGMRQTVAGEYGSWGLTTTTVHDRLRLLRMLVDASSPLTEESRSYVLGLMRTVAVEQRWGVPAASDPWRQEDAAVKNGWVPREKTGLWVVNSTGIIRREGHQVLVAVLSDSQPGYPQGTEQAEKVAVAGVGAVLDAEYGRPTGRQTAAG